MTWVILNRLGYMDRPLVSHQHTALQVNELSAVGQYKKHHFETSAYE